VYAFASQCSSDVSLVNEKFVLKNKKRLTVKEKDLKYPTGERVPFKSKVLINVQIKKYSLEITMFIVRILNLWAEAINTAVYIRKMPNQGIKQSHAI